MTEDEDRGEPTPHDNDADARPRVYMRAATPDAVVEVTVQGCEGDAADDVASLAAERFDHAVQSEGQLSDVDADGKGFD